MSKTLKNILTILEDLCDGAENIMDYMGKAMVSNQVSKLSKGLGLDDEEDNRGNDYDPKREQEEEAKRAQEKAKREETHTKRKAERATKRNEIREKYGLKESKVDNDLIMKGKMKTDNGNEKKCNSLTREEKIGNRHTDAPTKDKEKCNIM